MPLSPNAVGLCSGPIEQLVTARWLMAFSASVGAVEAPYLDTCHGPSLAAHPVFPVCLEWLALQGLRVHQSRAGLSDEELARNVHGSLDLHLLRPLRADEVLHTRAEVVGIEPRGDHAWQWVRIDTVDAQGELVARSFQGGVFLNVAVDGSAAFGDRPPATPWTDGTSIEPLATSSAGDIDVPAGAAHIYSETSRIWNPAHTDRRVALAAGLPGLILHGTATLAMTVTQLVARHADGQPERVRRVGCRFGAPVMFPSRLHWSTQAVRPDGLSFQVHDASGRAVLRSGYLVWD